MFTRRLVVCVAIAGITWAGASSGLDPDRKIGVPPAAPGPRSLVVDLSNAVCAAVAGHFRSLGSPGECIGDAASGDQGSAARASTFRTARPFREDIRSVMHISVVAGLDKTGLTASGRFDRLVNVDPDLGLRPSKGRSVEMWCGETSVSVHGPCLLGKRLDPMLGTEIAHALLRRCSAGRVTMRFCACGGGCDAPTILSADPRLDGGIPRAPPTP